MIIAFSLLLFFSSSYFNKQLVYIEPTTGPAPSWLVSSIGCVLQCYCKLKWFESHTGYFLLATAKFEALTATMLLALPSLSLIKADSNNYYMKSKLPQLTSILLKKERTLKARHTVKTRE